MKENQQQRREFLIWYWWLPPSKVLFTPQWLILWCYELICSVSCLFLFFSVMMTFLLAQQPLASWRISAHSFSNRDSAFVVELRNIFETVCSGQSIKDKQCITTTNTEFRKSHITLKSGLSNENKKQRKNFKLSARESAKIYYNNE